MKMITPVTLTNPFETTWYHGTNADPFSDWQCPPPSSSPVDVPHTGLFFTADQDFAKGAGKNVCAIQLSDHAKLIVPARRDAESIAFRKAVMRSGPLAAHCHWLTDDTTWVSGWSTGEVMRFCFDKSNREAALEFDRAMTSLIARLKRRILSPISEDMLTKHAATCLTRGWIEQLLLEAKKMGYQAIQGAEIDRHGAVGSVPVAQPWLAVMDTSTITAPVWH